MVRCGASDAPEILLCTDAGAGRRRVRAGGAAPRARAARGHRAQARDRDHRSHRAAARHARNAAARTRPFERSRPGRRRLRAVRLQSTSAS